MRLSTKGRYAVMAMADLAGNAGEGRPVALADIAERQDISLSYLEQLFAKLRRGGLVTSVRGPGGGYRLSRPSGELRIADIIVAVDEPIAATRCSPTAPRAAPRPARAASPMTYGRNWASRSMCSSPRSRWPMWWRRRVLGRSRPCNDFEGAGRQSRISKRPEQPCLIAITTRRRRCGQPAAKRWSALCR